MTPTATVDQRNRALETANRIRQAKARLRRQLSSLSLHPGKLLCEPGYAVDNLDDDEIRALHTTSALTAEETFRAIRGWGLRRSLKLLSRAGVRPHRRAGSLTPHERIRLRSELEAAGWWDRWET